MTRPPRKTPSAKASRPAESSAASESGTLDRDYVAEAIAYARAAVADKKGKKFGRLLRLGAKRFLTDLERAKRASSPFHFDEWHAGDVCRFLERLPHVEGKWSTPDIVLHASHVFFLVQLFGFRRNEGATEIDGVLFYPRRFTSALFAVARKNAKSTLAAGILLYCECCEPEEGAQVISAATTFPQASIVFNHAKRMVEKTPDLREAFGLATFSKSIARGETGASFKPIHAKASTQDGLNPSHIGLDEIHAHKTPDLLNVLTSAAGARGNPLFLYTTTEGYTNPGPWAEIRQFAKQLLEGLFGDQADHFLAVFFAVDDADGDFDEAAWLKANPLAECNPHLISAIRKEAVEAKAMPSKLAEFRIKRLNRPASVANGWTVLPKWMACSGAVDLEALRDVPCWGGLDLASTRDLCAFRLVWRVEDRILTWGRRWAPEAAVAFRTERGTVPYAGWVAGGLLEQTPGDVTDYDVIERAVLDLVEHFNVQLIGFDKWNALTLVNRLVPQLPEGMLLEFVQGPKSYHPAMQELERAYISEKLDHGGDQLLNWCAANLVARTDVNMNTAPDRKRSTDKIDDMVALLMAVGVSAQPAEPTAHSQPFVVL